MMSLIIRMTQNMTMWKPGSKRLSESTYNRPAETYTEKLSVNEIKEKLADYVKVDNIKDVPIGTHLRYFIVKNGNKLFRLGGFLLKNNGLPKYIILSNGDKTWSVQTKDTIFFRKQSIPEIKDNYDALVVEKDKLIKKQDQQIKELHAAIKKLQSAPKGHK